MRAPILLSLLFVVLFAGCSSTPTADEQALKDVRDTTIIPNLGSYDDQVQKEAVQRMLSVLGSAPEIARNLLVSSLRDPVYDNRTKMVCAWLLSTVGDRRALPTLMEFLGQGTDTTESLVREAVANYGASIVPAVSRLLEEGNDLARLAAAEILTDLEAKEGFDALAARFPREPEPRVRFLILCGLSADLRAESIEAFELALRDADAMNRELAWDTLVRGLKLPSSLTFDAYGSDSGREAQITAYLEWRAARVP